MPFVYAIIKMLLRICRFRQPYAGMAELADVQVLGSCAIGMRVCELSIRRESYKDTRKQNRVTRFFQYDILN